MFLKGHCETFIGIPLVVFSGREFENVQPYFSNSMAEIETRILARFLLFFSYNNSNTSAIISGKIFKLAKILLKILFRLSLKFLKFWPKSVLKFWPKLVLKILQPKYLHFLFTQRP